MEKKNSVVLFTDTIQDLNGVSRFIQDMAYCGKDDEFYVISSSSFTNYDSKPNIINTKPFFEITMPFYKDMKLVFPNFNTIKKEYLKLKPKSIIVSTPGFFGICALLLTRKDKNLKKIAIYHTDFPAYLYDNTKSKIVEKITTWYMKAFYSRFDVVFTRSKEYETNLIDVVGIKKENIHILPSGINRANFSPNFKDVNFYPQNFKALYVGRLSIEKNFDMLLRIWPKIYQIHKDAILLCCGQGKFLNDKDRYEKDGIYLLGAKTGFELAKIYASSDIFLFPSTTDTLGQVVMEAGSSGIGAIVSDKGGPKNLVVHGNSGYVLEAKDVIWQEMILKAIEDKNLLIELKVGALENSKNFDFSKSYKAIMNEARV